jgi:hypothetical protein
MRAAAACLLLGALLLAGCGSAAAPPPGPDVRLALLSPSDGLRTSAATITVRGRVRPARAHVLVLGRRVPVARDGSFSTSIHLADGANLIDVLADAPRSTGAVSALRLVRFLLVTVPDLTKESPATATRALRALGLRVRTTGSGDPFGFLVPLRTQVCATTPAAGARVDPGTTVTVQTGKVCFFDTADRAANRASVGLAAVGLIPGVSQHLEQHVGRLSA